MSRVTTPGDVAWRIVEKVAAIKPRRTNDGVDFVNSFVPTELVRQAQSLVRIVNRAPKAKRPRRPINTVRFQSAHPASKAKGEK